jgi:hypothetical protein
MPRETKKTSPRTATRRSGSSGSKPGAKAALQAIARAMKRLKARWYLFGAQAVLLHGAPRTTQDIDVTVLTEAPTATLLRALRAERIIPRFDDEAFIAQTRVVPCEHRPSGWKVDVVLGGPGLEELIASQAIVRKLGGVSVPLLRLEHLLVLKVFAGRPQDLADVSALLSLPGKSVDFAEVRGLLLALETELAEGPLVERFDLLVPPRRA